MPTLSTASTLVFPHQTPQDPQCFLAIRHPHAQHNHKHDQGFDLTKLGEDTSATPEGKRQARDLSTIISSCNTPIERVICGPLRRTIRLAETVLMEHGYKGEIIIDPLVSEFRKPDYSFNQGPPRKDMETFYAQQSRITGLNYNVSNMPNGDWCTNWETIDDVIERCNAFAEKYFGENAQPHTVVFSHMEWIQTFIKQDDITIPNCSVTLANAQTRESQLLCYPKPVASRQDRRAEVPAWPAL